MIMKTMMPVVNEIRLTFYLYVRVKDLQTSTYCKEADLNDLKMKLGSIILISLRKNSDFEYRGY